MNKKLQNNLMAIRKIQGSSMAEFAKEIDVSRTTLRNIETGKANLTLDMVDSIAKRLGISPISLLTDEYDAKQLKITRVLLEAAKCLRGLEEEEQEEVIRHFESIVRILSKAEREENKPKAE